MVVETLRSKYFLPLFASLMSRLFGRPPPYSAQWGGRLLAIKDRLLAFTDRTEHEFLATGARLQDLHRQLDELRGLTEQVAGLTAPALRDWGSAYALCLLKKAEDLAYIYDERVLCFVRDLEKLQGVFYATRRSYHQLFRLFIPLQNISILFRIEAAHYPLEIGAVFRGLGRKIQDQVDRLKNELTAQLQELEKCCQGMAKLIVQTRLMATEYQKNMRTTVGCAQRHFQMALAALQDIQSAGTMLATRNSEIAQHLHGIIMAQQCQDITRQKIEHIGQALDEIKVHITQATRLKEMAQCRCYAAHAASIQSAQLRQVFTELMQAAQKITGHIAALRQIVSTATHAAIAGTENSLNTGIVELCRESMLQIIQHLQRLQQNLLSGQQAGQNCLSNASKLAKQTAYEARFDALNAEVFAAHVADGATLTRLAEQTRATAGAIISHIQIFAQTLNTISQQLQISSQVLEDFAQLTEYDRQMLARETEMCVTHLHKVQLELPQLVAALQAKQAALANAVTEMLQNIQFPEFLPSTAEEVKQMFDAFVAWAGTGGHAHVGISAALHRLKSRYTMHSERHIHDAALKDQSAEDATPAVYPVPEASPNVAEAAVSLPANAVDAADVPGDNVELF